MNCLSWRHTFHESWENKSKFQMGGLRETGGLLLFSPVSAHLLTTLKGSGISCGNRALCEADAAWREAWADVSNRCLERAGREERIDHRSNAARGLDEIPTIHEGVAAQALERKGIISDRCEINRQIKADNALLRELKAEIKKLAALVARTVPVVAEGLEKLRSRVA